MSTASQPKFMTTTMKEKTAERNGARRIIINPKKKSPPKDELVLPGGHEFPYTAGSFYVGEWQGDKKSGFGTQTWTSGDKYEGEWSVAPERRPDEDLRVGREEAVAAVPQEGRDGRSGGDGVRPRLRVVPFRGRVRRRRDVVAHQQEEQGDHLREGRAQRRAPLRPAGRRGGLRADVRWVLRRRSKRNGLPGNTGKAKGRHPQLDW